MARRPDREEADTPLQATIRQNITRLREIRGWSQADVVNHMRHEMTPAKLGRIERGERRVTGAEAVALSVAFGVTPSQILLPWADTGRSALPAEAVDGGQGNQSGTELQEWGMGRKYPTVLSPRTSTYEASLLMQVFASLTAQRELRENPRPGTLSRLVEAQAFTTAQPYLDACERFIQKVENSWPSGAEASEAASQDFWDPETRVRFASDSADFFALLEASQLHELGTTALIIESFDPTALIDTISSATTRMKNAGLRFGELSTAGGIEITTANLFDPTSGKVVRWPRWPEFAPIPLNSDSARKDDHD